MDTKMKQILSLSSFTFAIVIFIGLVINYQDEVCKLYIMDSSNFNSNPCLFKPGNSFIITVMILPFMWILFDKYVNKK